MTRDGIGYETGIGMDGGYTEAEVAGDTNKAGDKRKRAPTTTTTPTAAKKKCNACGGTNHLRITSKKCDKHQDWLLCRGKVIQTDRSTARQMLERDSIQQEAFDFLPLTDDIKVDEDYGLPEETSDDTTSDSGDISTAII